VAKEEFFNFEEALDELRLKEEELKRLVSEGEIRAFRDGETMRLRREDVAHLKNELLGGDVVDLGGAGEELVFEDELEPEDTGMATEEIADMDTLLEADVEDVGSEIDLDAPVEEPELETASAGSSVRRTSSRAGQADGAEAGEGMGIRAVAILTSLVLLLAIPVAISVSSGSPGQIARMVAGLFGKEI